MGSLVFAFLCFAEDCHKMVVNARHELVLIISVGDKNAVQRTLTPPTGNPTVPDTSAVESIKLALGKLT